MRYFIITSPFDEVAKTGDGDYADALEEAMQQSIADVRSSIWLKEKRGHYRYLPPSLHGLVKTIPFETNPAVAALEVGQSQHKSVVCGFELLTQEAQQSREALIEICRNRVTPYSPQIIKEPGQPPTIILMSDFGEAPLLLKDEHRRSINALRKVVLPSLQFINILLFKPLVRWTVADLAQLKDATGLLELTSFSSEEKRSIKAFIRICQQSDGDLEAFKEEIVKNEGFTKLKRAMTTMSEALKVSYIELTSMCRFLDGKPHRQPQDDLMRKLNGLDKTHIDYLSLMQMGSVKVRACEVRYTGKKTRVTQKFNAVLDAARHDPHRLATIQNMIQTILKETRLDVPVVDIHIRPPVTGAMIFPEDIDLFHQHGIVVQVTIHEYKQNDTRRHLQVYTHEIIQKADKIKFFNHKEKTNARKAARTGQLSQEFIRSTHSAALEHILVVKLQIDKIKEKTKMKLPLRAKLPKTAKYRSLSVSELGKRRGLSALNSFLIDNNLTMLLDEEDLIKFFPKGGGIIDVLYTLKAILIYRHQLNDRQQLKKIKSLISMYETYQKALHKSVPELYILEHGRCREIRYHELSNTISIEQGRNFLKANNLSSFIPDYYLQTIFEVERTYRTFYDVVDELIKKQQKIIETEAELLPPRLVRSITDRATQSPAGMKQLDKDIDEPSAIVSKQPNIICFGTIRAGKGFQEAIELAKLIKQKHISEHQAYRHFSALKGTMPKVIVAGRPADRDLTIALLAERFGLEPGEIETLKRQCDEFVSKNKAEMGQSAAIIKFFAETLESLNKPVESGGHTVANEALEIHLDIPLEEMPSLKQRCKYVLRVDEMGMRYNGSGIINVLDTGIVFAKWGSVTDKEFYPHVGEYQLAAHLGQAKYGRFYGKAKYGVLTRRDKRFSLASGRMLKKAEFSRDPGKILAEICRLEEDQFQSGSVELCENYKRVVSTQQLLEKFKPKYVAEQVYTGLSEAIIYALAHRSIPEVIAILSHSPKYYDHLPEARKIDPNIVNAMLAQHESFHEYIIANKQKYLFLMRTGQLLLTRLPVALQSDPDCVFYAMYYDESHFRKITDPQLAIEVLTRMNLFKPAAVSQILGLYLYPKLSSDRQFIINLFAVFPDKCQQIFNVLPSDMQADAGIIKMFDILKIKSNPLQPIILAEMGRIPKPKFLSVVKANKLNLRNLIWALWLAPNEHRQLCLHQLFHWMNSQAKGGRALPFSYADVLYAMKHNGIYEFNRDGALAQLQAYPQQVVDAYPVIDLAFKQAHLGQYARPAFIANALPDFEALSVDSVSQEIIRRLVSVDDRFKLCVAHQYVTQMALWHHSLEVNGDASLPFSVSELVRALNSHEFDSDFQLDVSLTDLSESFRQQTDTALILRGAPQAMNLY